MIKFLLFSLFLIILFICKPVVEGFQMKSISSCNDKFSKGETNYAIESNILKNLKSFTTSIIKQTKKKLPNILNLTMSRIKGL